MNSTLSTFALGVILVVAAAMFFFSTASDSGLQAPSQIDQFRDQ